MAESNSETVVVVVEQKYQSDRIRRVFSNYPAAQNYINDPENEGNFYTEEHAINTEWEPSQTV